MAYTVVLSCEHASHEIPEAFLGFFRGAEIALQTHRGFDIGAWEVCQELSSLCPAAPVFRGQYSRLVVDLNRSEHHPKVFSEWTHALHPLEKEKLLAQWHRPYRNDVRRCVRSLLAESQSVLHLSLHSFTPLLDHQERRNDLGLLYDPSRGEERSFALQWESQLERRGLYVRRNYPYRGVSDGLVTWLRREFPQGYLGFEVEWSQRYLEQTPASKAAHYLWDSLPRL